MGRMQLIHTHRRWPDAISLHLWPYAMQTANSALNLVAFLKESCSPTELFSGVPVAPNARHAHAFGCPAYVLDQRMQASSKIPKWSEHSRVGIYLGPSWAHAKLVGLILSLTTGLVSPQFHVKYNDTFESVKQLNLTGSMWQHKCHFIEDSNVPRMITTTPSISMIKGGSLTQDGAACAQELQQPIHELGPLPHPLPLEPWAELQLEEEQEGFYPPDMEEPEIQDEEPIIHPIPIPVPQAKPPVGADITVCRSN